MTVETDDSIVAAAAAGPSGTMSLGEVYREKVRRTKNSTEAEYHKLSLPEQVRLLREAMGKPALPEPVDCIDDEVLDKASGAVILSQIQRAVVTALPDGTVKKWTGRKTPNMNEVEAMRVANELGLPLVPRVLGMGVSPHDPGHRQKSWIAMTRLDGERLLDVWDGLGPEDKTSVAVQLRDYLAAMRSVPAPAFTSVVTNRTNQRFYDDVHSGGYRGIDYGGHFASSLRATDTTPADDAKGTHYGGPRPGMVGVDRHPPFLPCRSEAEFNEYMLSYLVRHMPRSLLETLATNLARAGPYRVVFSHGDLTMENILVTRSDGTGGGIKLSGIVGWRHAGWFPEYWEYIKAFARGFGKEDYRDYLPAMFAPNDYRDTLLTYLVLKVYRCDPTE